MPAKRSSFTALIGFGWTVAAGVVSFIFAAAVFYATTSGTLVKHSEAINDLTKVLKEESKARTEMEKNEAAAREKLRAEYMGQLREQTSTFTNLSGKLGDLGAEVKVLGTKYDAKYESINERLNKVLDQTAPHTGGTPRRR